jgi:hypothetical protein
METVYMKVEISLFEFSKLQILLGSVSPYLVHGPARAKSRQTDRIIRASQENL